MTIKRASRPRVGAAILVFQLCLVSTPIFAVASSCQEASAVQQKIEKPNAFGSDTKRVCIADGEYEITTQNGIGPFVPAVYGFKEWWTLWKLADGSFMVTGTRSYRSPSTESHENDFTVRLDPDLEVKNLTEFRKLEWRWDSGPISCDFLAKRIHCTSNAKRETDNVTLDLSLDHTFGFLWPISAFSLSGISRSVSRDPRTPIPVDMVRVEEEATISDPIMATILSGDLKYLGQETLELAGRVWQADKFELKVPLHAPFLMWTSPEGLLLAFGTETKTKTLPADGMVLTKFRQWAQF